MHKLCSFASVLFKNEKVTIQFDNLHSSWLLGFSMLLRRLRMAYEPNKEYTSMQYLTLNVLQGIYS